MLGLINDEREVPFDTTVEILSEEISLKLASTMVTESTDPDEPIAVSETEDTDFEHMEFYIVSADNDAIVPASNDKSQDVSDGGCKV